MTKSTRGAAGFRRALAAATLVASLAVLEVAAPPPVSAAGASTLDGSTPADAAASCWEIKQQHPASADGIYWLRNDQLVRPEQFYCDMSYDGGGWVLIGRLGSVSPTAGQFTNIESITAVVIGGISLFGGRGSVLGMLFGALIVGVFSLGLRLVGTDPQWTYLLIGVLIISAVAIDQWIRKVSA